MSKCKFCQTKEAIFSYYKHRLSLFSSSSIVLWPLKSFWFKEMHQMYREREIFLCSVFLFLNRGDDAQHMGDTRKRTMDTHRNGNHNTGK